MRKHLIIPLIMLISLLLSACTENKLPTEISSVPPAPVIEIIEETLTKITTSEPLTTEKSTTNITVSNEEKKENISTSVPTLPLIIKTDLTEKPKPTEDKTTIKNVPEPTKQDEEVTVQSTEPATDEHKVDIDYYVDYAKNYVLNIGLTYDVEVIECWDNPISVISKTTFTIANIESRLNRYKNIEGFESVCIWYEKCVKNDYDLYRGYA